jgi:peptidoglycan/xylan/chitin deacetylase (PgdA/CDA1 family)
MPPRATTPLRRLAARVGPRRGALVLLYHRVAETTTDPQQLAVAPKRFAEHLDVVAEQYEPVSLSRLVAALRRGEDVHRLVAVTFDDGYADNLLAAKPLLERAGVPATVFVASGYVRGGGEFWWDELEGLLLRPGRLPPVVTLAVSAEELRLELGADATYSAQDGSRRAGWSVLAPNDPGPRQALYRDLCSRFMRLDAETRAAALARLRSFVADGAGTGVGARPLAPEELARLAEGDLLEVGAHTVSHPVLVRLPRRRQDEEIAGSKRELEDIVGRPVTSFAYPYGARGDFDETAVSIVGAAGFERACTAIAGRVTPRTDPLRIPRLVVRDCGAAELERQLGQAVA